LRERSTKVSTTRCLSRCSSTWRLYTPSGIRARIASALTCNAIWFLCLQAAGARRPQHACSAIPLHSAGATLHPELGNLLTQLLTQLIDQERRLAAGGQGCQLRINLL